MKDIGESSGGFIGLLNPEHLEKGDPKTLGKEIQKEANILENVIKYMDFQSWERKR